MEIKTMLSGKALNDLWESRIKKNGADFVRFVDISPLPDESTLGFSTAVIFGKALSAEYIRAIRDGITPKTKEVLNTERKMDALALKIAAMLTEEGYESLGKLKTGVLPHKTVALRAGLGFIGKNNLLVTEEFGCAQMLGKVLTNAPFESSFVSPQTPKCRDCRICADVCPSDALSGTTWTINSTREEIITRKLCTLCVKCMAACPYTLKYIENN